MINAQYVNGLKRAFIGPRGPMRGGKETTNVFQCFRQGRHWSPIMTAESAFQRHLFGLQRIRQQLYDINYN